MAAAIFSAGKVKILKNTLVFKDGTEISSTDAANSVTNASTSTDDAIARFDSTTGKIVQDSGVTITDADVVSGATQLNVDNMRLDGNTLSSTDTDGDINIDPDGTGDVKINGAVVISVDKIYNIQADSGAFTAIANSTTVVTTSGGAATVTLPAPATTEFVTIKDGGNAETNNITINQAVAETIDGAASYVISSNYGSVTLVSDSVNWWIL